MNGEQKWETLPILFRGDALCYYKEHLKKQAKNYQSVVALIEENFDSLAQQIRIKNHLLSINTDGYKATPTPDTLENLTADIDRLFPQTPVTYRCEDNKVDILKWSWGILGGHQRFLKWIM